MSDTIKLTCRGCMAVVNTNTASDPDNILCDECDTILKYIRRPLVKWLHIKDRIRKLLWSICNQCIIQENMGLSLPYTSLDNKVIYDFTIPEYKLLIDIETPDAVSGTDAQLELVALKQQVATRNGYRYISLLSNEKYARNLLLYTINEFTIQDRYGYDLPLHTPKYDGDVGWDIICSEDMQCPPNAGTDVPSNLYMALPNHLYAIVQARSSTSKKRIIVLPGVLDPGYRGRVFIMIYNLTNETITIKRGERLAQLLVFHRIPHLHMNTSSVLPTSQRSDRGFGSTG